MLWSVQHKWPSGERFVFNWYRHWYNIGIREGDGAGHFLHSKEGVNQGYPLAMIEYGLGILTFIWDFRTAQPGVTQTWYADDAGVGGTFNDIRWNLDDLMVRRPRVDIYWIQPIVYWSCLHGTSCKWRPYFVNMAWKLWRAAGIWGALWVQRRRTLSG